LVGYCSFCEHRGVRAWEPAPIYRSSLRSLTFRCPECGLQWTMTVHRLARVVRRAHARAKEQGAKDERWLAELLDDLQDWDEALVERRGRCPAASATTVD
jgi:hypothetical protein